MSHKLWVRIDGNFLIQNDYHLKLDAIWIWNFIHLTFKFVQFILSLIRIVKTNSIYYGTQTSQFKSPMISHCQHFHSSAILSGLFSEYSNFTPDETFENSSWSDKYVSYIILTVYSTSDKRHDCSRKHITGDFSCLEGFFVLRRHISYYLIHIYIPSVLCVIVSWMSFWIKLESAPARVTCGKSSISGFILKWTTFVSKPSTIGYGPGQLVGISLEPFCLIFPRLSPLKTKL